MTGIFAHRNEVKMGILDAVLLIKEHASVRGPGEENMHVIELVIIWIPSFRIDTSPLTLRVGTVVNLIQASHSESARLSSHTAMVPPTSDGPPLD